MAIARFLDCMCLALRASGLWLRYTTLQNLIPSFPWIASPRPPPWRNPRKGRDQILPSGNIAAHLPLGVKARSRNLAPALIQALYLCCHPTEPKSLCFISCWVCRAVLVNLVIEWVKCWTVCYSPETTPKLQDEATVALHHFHIYLASLPFFRQVAP